MILLGCSARLTIDLPDGGQAVYEGQLVELELSVEPIQVPSPDQYARYVAGRQDARFLLTEVTVEQTNGAQA